MIEKVPLRLTALYYIIIYAGTALCLIETQSLPCRRLSPGPWVQSGQSSGLGAWSLPDCSQLKNTSAEEKSLVNKICSIIVQKDSNLFYCFIKHVR